MNKEQLKTKLNDLTFSIDELIKTAYAEQDESENQHTYWENERGEDDEDEPEIIDNNTEISAYREAKALIKRAIEALA